MLVYSVLLAVMASASLRFSIGRASIFCTLLEKYKGTIQIAIENLRSTFQTDLLTVKSIQFFLCRLPTSNSSPDTGLILFPDILAFLLP